MSLAGWEYEVEQRRIAAEMAELTEATLWQRALGAKPPSGSWRIYFTGELHEAAAMLGHVTRELVRRKLAVMAQRRAKKTGKKDPGFEYLIAAVRRDAVPVPFGPVEDAPAVPTSTPRGAHGESYFEKAFAAGSDAPAVPKSTGRKRSEETQRILAAFDECGDRLETARRLELSEKTVYLALYNNRRIGRHATRGAK